MLKIEDNRLVVSTRRAEAILPRLFAAAAVVGAVVITLLSLEIVPVMAKAAIVGTGILAALVYGMRSDTSHRVDATFDGDTGQISMTKGGAYRKTAKVYGMGDIQSVVSVYKLADGEGEDEDWGVVAVNFADGSDAIISSQAMVTDLDADFAAIKSFLEAQRDGIIFQEQKG